MKDTDFNPEQSLKLIEQMISSAKARIANQSFYFIFWGWGLFAAALSEYILKNIVMFEYFWIGWPIIGFGGGIVSAIYGAMQSKKEKNCHHLDKVITSIWIGFFIAVWVLIFALPPSYMTSSSSIIMILTGWATFVTGHALKFTPLKLGAIAFWVFGFVSFRFFPEYSSLFFAAGIFLGYILPGHLLRHAEKNNRI